MISIEDLEAYINKHYNYNDILFHVNNAIHTQAMYHRTMLENNLKLINITYAQLEDDYNRMKRTFIKLVEDHIDKPKLTLVKNENERKN